MCRDQVEDSDSSTGGLASATSPLIPAPPPAPDLASDEPPAAATSSDMADLLNSALAAPPAPAKRPSTPSKPSTSSPAKVKGPPAGPHKDKKGPVPLIPLDQLGETADPRQGLLLPPPELRPPPFAAACIAAAVRYVTRLSSWN